MVQEGSDVIIRGSWELVEGYPRVYGEEAVDPEPSMNDDRSSHDHEDNSSSSHDDEDSFSSLHDDKDSFSSLHDDKDSFSSHDDTDSFSSHDDKDSSSHDDKDSFSSHDDKDFCSFSHDDKDSFSSHVDEDFSSSSHADEDSSSHHKATFLPPYKQQEVKDIIMAGKELIYLLLSAFNHICGDSPPAGAHAFLSSVWGLRWPWSLTEVETRMAANQAKFSGDYYTLFCILAIILMFPQVYASVSLTSCLQALTLLLLCGFLRVEDRRLGDRHISTWVQRVFIFHLILLKSGLGAVLLSSMSWAFVVVLLHMVFHNPSAKPPNLFHPPLFWSFG